MSKEVEIERDKGDSTDGKTDYERLDSMSEEEIEQNAKSDPDAPLLDDDDLKKFKRVNPKNGGQNG